MATTCMMSYAPMSCVAETCGSHEDKDDACDDALSLSSPEEEPPVGPTSGQANPLVQEKKLSQANED